MLNCRQGMMATKNGTSRETTSTFATKVSNVDGEVFTSI